MKKTVAAISSSVLLALGGSFFGSTAWAELGDPIGSVIVGNESVTIVEAGQAFTARVENQNADRDFCGVPAGVTREGNTMAIKLYDALGDEILYTVPEGYQELSQGILPPFSWIGAADTTVDVSATIPVTAVPGKYKFAFECVGPVNEEDDYPVGGINPALIDIEILAASNDDPDQADKSAVNPSLAQTGNDGTGQYGSAGAAAILLATGAGVFLLRRRALAKK